MSEDDGSDITELLRAYGSGDDQAFGRLMPLVYEDLRRIARGQLRRSRPASPLDTASLVHRVYVKLADGRRLRVEDREHFFALAARSMRHVLVDLARQRGRLKRGGKAPRVSFDEAITSLEEQTEMILAVHEALDVLGRLDARLVRVVECRLFAGFTAPETAQILGCSRATVQRDWARARAWLREIIERPD